MIDDSRIGRAVVQCECGIAFTPDLALADGESPRRHVELDL